MNQASHVSRSTPRKAAWKKFLLVTIFAGVALSACADWVPQTNSNVYAESASHCETSSRASQSWNPAGPVTPLACKFWQVYDTILGQFEQSNLGYVLNSGTIFIQIQQPPISLPVFGSRDPGSNTFSGSIASSVTQTLTAR